MAAAAIHLEYSVAATRRVTEEMGGRGNPPDKPAGLYGWGRIEGTGRSKEPAITMAGLFGYAREGGTG